MKHLIQFVRTARGLGKPFSAFIVRSAIKRTLKAQGVDYPCLVSVSFTDDEGIREINRELRSVDSATDVLSFPFNELQAGSFCADSCICDPETGCIILGDMVLSIPRCVQQGIEFGHGFNRELRYLTVHSVLHLLGYDHIDEGEMKSEMRAREKEIMGDG